MSGSGAGSPGEEMYGIHNGSYGLMPRARAEIFHHHTYDLIKKKDEEIAKLKEEHSVMKEALEKIEDPRKMDHQERDTQTQIYCLQNVAHVALEKVRGTYGLELESSVPLV